MRMAALLGLALSLAAQEKLDTGDIAGTVTDAAHQAIAGASITAIESGRGIRLHAQSGPGGGYRLTLLPPGLYRVEFDMPGFAHRAAEGVSVSVGGTIRLDQALSPASAEFTITVSADLPAIDGERTQQATLIDSSRIENLPINRRDYMDFVLLSPGVVDTTQLADSADFRVPSTPTSNLGFAGSTGRGNTFTVDGVENNGSSGNVRPSLSQDAVQEFQVNRGNYSAEFGGAYGGAVNIVSKSGSNAFHGALFGYLRDRDLEARNFFDPGRSAFTRVQAGASAGGPIRRDRTFFFAAVERLQLQQTIFVPILEDPGVLSQLSTSQQSLLAYLRNANPGAAAAMAAVLNPGANPQVVKLFDTNSGVFPFTSGSTQVSARLDHQFSPRHNFFLRANLTAETDRNSQFGALEGLNAGLFKQYWDGGFAAQEIFRISPRWTGVTRLAFAYDRYTVLPNDPYGPALDITGSGLFGRNIQTPSDQRDRHFDAQEILNYTIARHAFKFGADFNPVRNESDPQVFFGGEFIFAQALPVSLILDGIAGSGYSAQLGAAQPSLASALSDPISAVQAYNLGLPVAYVQGFGNPRQDNVEQRYSGCVEDSFRPRENWTLTAGLRYQHEGNQHLHSQDRAAPRFGFAWTPRHRADWVVRGGFGVFQSVVDFYAVYSAEGLRRPDLSLVEVPITGVPVTNPMTGQPLTSVDIYRTLAAEGIFGKRSIEYRDMAQFGIPAGFRFPITGSVSSDFRNPYSEQASFEVEHSFGSLAVSAAYNFNRGLHIPRTFDSNLYQAGTRPDGWPIFGTINPNLANNYIMSSTANSYYDALVLQANRRFLRHWAVNVHYTWSKSIDDVTDYDMDFMPQNQFDARADRALSPFHRGHVLVATAVMESPVTGAGTRARLLGGWTVSLVSEAMSFQPFNVLTGYDNVGDGQENTHRPLGAGRDIGIGPNLFTLDGRVQRVWRPRLDSSLRVAFIAEGFNLPNRTNFQSVNNVVGALTLAQLPHPLVGNAGDPAQPLSFTAARDPRQFQLALRISF